MTTTSTLPTIFNYSNHSVRTVVKEDKSLWFVAKDVAEALDIAWQGTKSLVAIPAAWIGVGKLPTHKKNRAGNTIVVNQELAIISEPAVYKLAFRSNKPEAERFTEWVAAEVLPSIRKTGTYTMPETLTPEEQHALSQAVKERSAGNGRKSAGSPAAAFIRIACRLIAPRCEPSRVKGIQTGLAFSGLSPDAG